MPGQRRSPANRRWHERQRDLDRRPSSVLPARRTPPPMPPRQPVARNRLAWINDTLHTSNLVGEDRSYIIEYLRRLEDAAHTCEGQEIQLRASERRLEGAEILLLRDRARLRSKDDAIAGLQVRLEKTTAELLGVERERDALKAKADEMADLPVKLERARKECLDLERQLRECKSAAEEESFVMRGLMQCGTKRMQEQREEITALTEQNEALMASLDGKQDCITDLKDKLVKFSMASTEEQVAMAMEAQAQRTLPLVEGLKEEIAERDAALKVSETEKNRLFAANQSYKVEIERLRQETRTSGLPVGAPVRRDSGAQVSGSLARVMTSKKKLTKSRCRAR